MKLINNTRYCTEDMQAIVDMVMSKIIPGTVPGYSFRYRQCHVLKVEDIQLVLNEHDIPNKEVHSWDPSGTKHGRVRMFVKPQSWSNPHRVYLMNPRMVEANKMAMLTATEDAEGWFDAPHELKEQFVATLVDRLHGPPAIQVGLKAARLEFQAAPTRLRYRIGTKPKPSAVGKELERVLHVYKLQNEVDTRAKRASSELHRVETTLRRLDKLQPEHELTLTPFEREMFKRNLSGILTALAKMEK